MHNAPLIVGLGGTTRPGSTTEKALGAALDAAKAAGCRTLLLGASALPLEPYDPARPERSAQAVALVAALREAEGLVVATPAYHGGISGLVKNAIDFTEDMRADQRVYFDGLAVGCIVSADGAQAMGSTLAALRSIIHALRGWNTPFSATLNSRDKPFGGDGKPADAAAIEACSMVGRQVAEFARMKRAARTA